MDVFNRHTSNHLSSAVNRIVAKFMTSELRHRYQKIVTHQFSNFYTAKDLNLLLYMQCYGRLYSVVWYCIQSDVTQGHDTVLQKASVTTIRNVRMELLVRKTSRINRTLATVHQNTSADIVSLVSISTSPVAYYVH